jgi:hypothetical protein
MGAAHPQPHKKNTSSRVNKSDLAKNLATRSLEGESLVLTIALSDFAPSGKVGDPRERQIMGR